VPVIQQPEYTVSVQMVVENNNKAALPVVHCDIREWGPVIAKRLKLDFECFVDLFNGPLYALSTASDAKKNKFLQAFNFEFLSEVQGTDGIARNLYVHKGNNNDGNG